MREGFHVYIDDQDKLVFAIAEPKQIRWMAPADVADWLIGYVEFNFAYFQRLIYELEKLPICDKFSELRYEDYLNFVETCFDVCREIEDRVGAHFLEQEFARIVSKPDDGSASYWLEQTDAMLYALDDVIETHTFMRRAFETCFGINSKDDLPQRARSFFKDFPDLEEHTFTEMFAYWPQTNRRLDYEHALRLTRELGTDFEKYYSALHEERNSLSIVKGYLMRSHRELLFFSFLELLRRDIRICRCACCGRYFVPRTKKKTLYCDRVIKGGKTCKDIGPKLMQRRSRQLDRTLREYERLYKMYYARAERYGSYNNANREKTENEMTFTEFFAWSDRAVKARKQYIAGELLAEEFLKKISLDEKDSQIGLSNLEHEAEPT